MSTRLQTTIDSATKGRYLIDLLSTRFTYHSRATWEHEIAQGLILLNGHPTSPHYELRKGDIISYTPEQGEEPPVPKNFSIIWQEQDFIAINKPPGLPSHPGGRYRTHSLWNLLLTDFHSPTLINRLDRETSGIIIAALTARGRRGFQQQHRQHKGYLVMVHGSFPGPLQAHGWIYRDPHSMVRKKQFFGYSYPDNIKAKSSLSTFHPLAVNEHFSLIKVNIETGRTHQIRATLHSLGYPVVGDKLYGLDESFFLRFATGQLSPEDRRLLIIGHQALHSARFCFTNELGEEHCLAAELPPEFARLVKQSFNIDLSSAPAVAKLWQ